LRHPINQLLGFSGAIPRSREDAMLERHKIARILIDHGARFATVIADLAIGEAQAGNAEAVRTLLDYPRFLRHGRCAAPDGWDETLFYATLRQEIKAKLTFYDTHARRGIRHGWRHDRVFDTQTPALQALQTQLRALVDGYIAALPHDPNHPFVAARPAEYGLRGWAVVSNGASHHISHIHPRAWLIGVYYVTEPEVSRAPGSNVGWLNIRAPENLGIGPQSGWEVQKIAPAPGAFVLMPAYFYHDTEPMGVDQERICIAFEAQPSELIRDGDGDY
jgi:hypothetical protein